jgi:hypothetical protein
LDARHSRGRWWLAAGAIIAIATSTAGCASAGGSATVAGPDPRTTTSATTAGSGPTTAATGGSGSCSAADLELASSQSNGGMGTVGTEFAMRNRGSHACRLSGVPTLRAVTTPGGAPAPVPVQPTGPGQSVTLAPGGSAKLEVTYPNGYAGWATDDPHCQHPVTYSQIAVVLDDGSALGLGEFQLAILCGGPINEAPWSAVQ